MPRKNESSMGGTMKLIKPIYNREELDAISNDITDLRIDEGPSLDLISRHSNSREKS